MKNFPFLKGKTVLITGGTGSFGQYFVKAILRGAEVKKIIVFSRDELKQSRMRIDISDPRIRFFLGDIRDINRLERAFEDVDVIVHAAALKQVPALEYNPLEAVKTNIIGTQNVIDAALDKGVEKVLLISSDKAVNPINLYGATKLCAEKLFVAANAYRKRLSPDKPKFSVVRYGNVIGSRGSIVDILNSQKLKGVVTLTHKDMTRFWITLNQGAELVLDALRFMRGGEVFIPKLSSMKVVDLIYAIAPKCRTKIIGIRPGEKMHEVLLTEDEIRRTKDAGKYYIVEPDHDWWDKSCLKKFNYLPSSFRYASNNVPILTRREFLNFI